MATVACTKGGRIALFSSAHRVVLAMSPGLGEGERAHYNAFATKPLEPEQWLAGREAKGWTRIPAPFTVYGLPGKRALNRWSFDSVAKAVDGCRIEPDGICQHGAPSWLLALNLI
jgi:hypothetical protein